jgi:hypothetical protein
MAIIPSARYSGQVELGDAGYPQGKARNAGAFQDGTGTPLERDWMNDLWGFLQALLDRARITPSGTPDRVGASQYVDAVQAVARASSVKRALVLRSIDVTLSGVTPTPLGTTLGAVSALGYWTVVARAGNNSVFAVNESPLPSMSAVTIPGLTSVRKLVRGSRILAIGDGGNKNAHSTTNGNTWSGGGATGLAAAVTDAVWDGTEFVISTGTGKAAHSTTGVAWAVATVGSDISNAINLAPDGGLAALSSGAVVAAGGQVDGSKVFARSLDHGQTWALSGSIPSSITDYVVGGSVAGNGGTEIYWLGKRDGVERLDLWVSTDGAAWSKRAEIPGFDGVLQPFLYMCPDTSLLVAFQENGNVSQVSASLDLGKTWSELVYYSESISQLSVARGRIFASPGWLASDPLL